MRVFVSKFLNLVKLFLGNFLAANILILLLNLVGLVDIDRNAFIVLLPLRGWLFLLSFLYILVLFAFLKIDIVVNEHLGRTHLVVISLMGALRTLLRFNLTLLLLIRLVNF